RPSIGEVDRPVLAIQIDPPSLATTAGTQGEEVRARLWQCDTLVAWGVHADQGVDVVGQLEVGIIRVPVLVGNAETGREVEEEFTRTWRERAANGRFESPHVGIRHRWRSVPMPMVAAAIIAPGRLQCKQVVEARRNLDRGGTRGLGVP